MMELLLSLSITLQGEYFMQMEVEHLLKLALDSTGNAYNPLAAVRLLGETVAQEASGES